ncbi:MAG: hypothetical protein KGQ50_04555 [Bacteroidetes bacterium]|nr:hypothetical protein [Bacteroidota bacterium]
MRKNLFLNLLSFGLSLFVFTNLTAQKCDAALRTAELSPYGTKSCSGKTGNYLQRTVCNESSTTYDPSTHAISLPKGRVASCFTIVGFSGRPDWKILDETGRVVFDPVMPTTAPRLGTLTLTAPAADRVYSIVLNKATSSKGAWITLGFVDYQP